ncbi:ATP-dependent RecD-like DNA helicase [Arenibaculum sp.]|jgi:exodeoxyribonuclease V alpha subunit|uniref:SF1B family DNA helicase RecD2 n=1 Tax=Arenibaculum sp. TaxID=2865862 RepID=UPI002E15BE58|nr:ATP-dependent RecD-like DNA helicase [Arenibaculum sp.]
MSIIQPSLPFGTASGASIVSGAGAQAGADAFDVLTGRIERVTYHDPDTGYCVLRVKPDGVRRPLTLVGHTAAIEPGEWVEAAGNWVQDPRHGLQLRAELVRVRLPGTAEAIEKYLGSGLIRGLGPVHARRLVRAFGASVFDVIEHEPARLRAVPGIGPLRAERILEAWHEQKAIREIMVFLHTHGVGTARAVRIFKTYGPDAVRLIREDPYRLARDVRGIGFAGADAVARSLGIDPTSMARARAGIGHVLARAAEDGHCGLPADELLASAAALLDVPEGIVDAALGLEVAAGDVAVVEVDGIECLVPQPLVRAEERIAARLSRLARGEPAWGRIDAAAAVAAVERDLGLSLAPGQRQALDLALRGGVLVITGGPGVGKTTLVDALVRVLRAAGAEPALAAPTGRAAKRLAEATGQPAATLHRLLEADPGAGGFRRNEARLLRTDLLVVDEASMVDLRLMDALLAALPPSAALVLIGDVDQLPPVGPGQVLADLVGSGTVPVVRLTDVFRQARDGRIVTNARRILEGLPPEPNPPGPTDFYVVEAASAEDALRKVVQVVTERVPRRFGFDPVRDVQVLCPMNRGLLGARMLNQELQRVLNPASETRIRRFGITFSPGDKVMQIENDYARDVYNGDLGTVSAVDPEARGLTVAFDGREVAYAAGELDGLALAYACTVHKAQGCEFPVVVVPVTREHAPMLHRDLLYTAVTRGRSLVVLVGERAALDQAVSGVRPPRRRARLAGLLADAASAGPREGGSPQEGRSSRVSGRTMWIATPMTGASSQGTGSHSGSVLAGTSRGQCQR